MKQFISYLKPEKKILGLALLMATLNQVFSLLNPQIFARIIDDYASRISDFTQGEFVQGVGLLLLLYIVVALVSRTAKAFQDYFVNTVSEKVGTSLYARSVEHVFKLPFSVFENQQSGSILQKLQQHETVSRNLLKMS